MTLDERIEEVKSAASDGAAYEMPATELLEYLTLLQEAGEVYDHLAKSLGFVPEDAPGWWQLVYLARERLKGTK